MIEIDGSVHSGSGTLLRCAVALATLTGRPLHMIRIRARRQKPGLRLQHLQAVTACRDLCGGEIAGGAVGSGEITFRPGGRIAGGDYRWDIGSAGSATMLAYTLIPLGLFADRPCRFTLAGGLFQDFAPSAFHLRDVLLRWLGQMGARTRLEIVRPGYVPAGQGEIVLETEPLAAPLAPLVALEPGGVADVSGVALASHLAEAQVARRMAERCRELLAARGYQARIEEWEDFSAAQPGAALFVRAATDTGCLIGADQAGRIGRASEKIGAFVARSLIQDLASGATVDRHAADQLILFAALARGTSEYVIPALSEHVQANLWLVERILGAGHALEGRRVRIEGAGWTGRPSVVG